MLKVPLINQQIVQKTASLQKQLEGKQQAMKQSTEKTQASKIAELISKIHKADSLQDKPRQ